MRSSGARAPSGPGRRARSVAWAAALLTALCLVVWTCTVALVARDARRALAAGRYAEARERARFWLRVRPGSADAEYVAARAAFALGEDRVFRESARRAVAAGLSSPRRSLLRALADVGARRQAAAEPALLAAIEAGEGPDPQIDEALARIYLETFRLRQAEVVLDRWAAEAPNDPRPYLWRAEADRRLRHGPEVLETDFRRALARAPASPAARLGLADALRALRRNAEALSEYAAYLELRPDDPDAHLGAAHASLDLGQEAEAARHLDRALALNPRHPDALKLVAEAAARRGDLTDALTLLDRAVALAPDEVDVRYARSLLLSRLGRRDDAAKEQAVVTRLRSDYSRLNELKERLLQSPGDNDLKAEIGRWMIDHGHDEEGKRWSDEVIRRLPGHPLANEVLRIYHSRRGQVGLANYYRLKAGGRPR